MRVLFVTEWQAPNKFVSVLLASYLHIWLSFVRWHQCADTGAKRLSVSVWCVRTARRCLCKCFITHNDNSHLQSFQSCQNLRKWSKKKTMGILWPKGIFLCPEKKTLDSQKGWNWDWCLKVKKWNSQTRSKNGALKFRIAETLLENPCPEGASLKAFHYFHINK